MRPVFIRSTSLLLLPLSLSACNTSLTKNSADTALIPPPWTEVQERSYEPVIENLVNQASLRGAAPVTPAPPEPAATEMEPEPEPQTPAPTVVQMTANRVVELAINDFLQNRRGMLQSWIGRGQVYFPMIEQIFAEEGVPDELKYLALSESGLNPTISSPAGAVGLWQFMAPTARDAGLRVDSWVDERRDPELATRAAARHIKALHQDYNGRWHLALAGYNCSNRCISRAVEEAGGNMENPPSYWDVYPYLPQETRDFVPRYIATALLVSNPEFYNLAVEDLGQELAYDRVWVNGMLSLADAARFAGTDLPSIKNLNPALLRNTLPNDAEPYALKIPLGTYERFTIAMQTVQPRSARPESLYVVKSGDTLGKIAAAHGVKVAELQELNGIDGALIKVNQQLRLPGHGNDTPITVRNTEREFVSYAPFETHPIELGEGFQLVQQNGSKPGKPLLAVRLTEIDADEGVQSLVPTIYKVRGGDTLGSIAKSFGVSVVSIQESNRLSGTVIYPDQELTIHSATSTHLEPAAPAPAATAQQNLRNYEVRPGDTLSNIANRFGLSVEAIKQRNALPDGTVHVGQNLLIY